MFREIAKFISAQTGFAIGSRLQHGHAMQDRPVRCVLVQETGGEPNFYCPDMMNMNIQVLCRAEKYSEAREDAYAVFEAIHGTSGWQLPRLDGSGEDYLAMTIEAMAVPQYIGLDDNKRHLFSTNYIFRMELGSCESGS